MPPKSYKRLALAPGERARLRRLVRVLRLWAKIHEQRNESGCGYLAAELRNYAREAGHAPNLDVALAKINANLEINKRMYGPGCAGTGGLPIRIVANGISSKMDKVAALAARASPKRAGSSSGHRSD